MPQNERQIQSKYKDLMLLLSDATPTYQLKRQTILFPNLYQFRINELFTSRRKLNIILYYQFP